MAHDNPLDAMHFELKRIEMKKVDSKALGMQAEEKGGMLVIRRVKEGSIGDKAGIKVGDYPLSFNGRSVNRRAELVQEMAHVESSVVLIVARRRAAPLDPAALKSPTRVERKGDCVYALIRVRTTKCPEMGMEVDGSDGHAVVKSVTTESVAQKAGLKAGDRILMVGEDAVRDAEHCKDALTMAAGAPIDLMIERPPTKVTIAATPEQTPTLALELEIEPITSSFNFQSIRKEIMGVPEDGVEPVPNDVQAIADKVRDAVANRITFGTEPKSKSKSRTRTKVSKPTPKGEPKSADKRVFIMSDISMKPLVKAEPPKMETPKMEPTKDPTKTDVKK